MCHNLQRSKRGDRELYVVFSRHYSVSQLWGVTAYLCNWRIHASWYHHCASDFGHVTTSKLTRSQPIGGPCETLPTQIEISADNLRVISGDLASKCGRTSELFAIWISFTPFYALFVAFCSRLETASDVISSTFGSHNICKIIPVKCRNVYVIKINLSREIRL